VNISKTKKRYSKKENAILLCFEKPFKSAAIIFYFIGTFMIILPFSKFGACLAQNNTAQEEL